jgi:hypothetical protein
MSAWKWVLAAVAVAGTAVGVVVWLQSAPEAPPPEDAATAPPQASAPQHYPLPETDPTQQTAEPLPQLDGSDDAVHSALAASLGQQPVEAFLVPKDFVRRVVALIDSLDRHPVPLEFRPVKHVAGLPVTQSQGPDLYVLQPDDAKRYTPWVTALQTVDAQKLVDLYLRYYPLMQKAYEDLGYPGKYFNDRVVQIIDHLLATPEVASPIELVRPKVLFQFADPALEQRSWGQKALIRMGQDNAAAVKAKLGEIRGRIAVSGGAREH